MIKRSQRQRGSALVIIIAIVVGVILLTLAFIFWQNISTNKSSKTNQTTTQPQKADVAPCGTDSNVVEEGNVFCSPTVGIKLGVPSIFKGKFTKVGNYEIFKGSIDYTDRISAGSSDVVYSAAISGNDNFTLTIAKEPLRSGYVDVSNANAPTYYDVGTGLLSNVTSPTRAYNSTTDSYTTSGSYSVASTVPSFDVAGTKIYHGSVGDAGTRIETYFAIINGSIVKIELTNKGYIGPSESDPSTVDASKIFDELDSAIKKIELVHS